MGLQLEMNFLLPRAYRVRLSPTGRANDRQKQEPRPQFFRQSTTHQKAPSQTTNFISQLLVGVAFRPIPEQHRQPNATIGRSICALNLVNLRKYWRLKNMKSIDGLPTEFAPDSMVPPG
ncbi:hypothetical protein ACVIW2_003685 [Bradyrhizobium huanghuaihaiense]|uniref:hypothetical protein n=1 Tax=Bradyrhizobium huanghuaihaiense TaxID=990078 RepID=UPI001FCE7EB9|nr:MULTISPECIES: hypothetical protein [Bradyrhizobium]UWU75051.1 hypothetical protein N2603_34135 [Bradyrhizobium sp. CB3035]